MPWYQGLPDWMLRQTPGGYPPPDLYRASMSLGDIGAGIGALGPYLRPGGIPPSAGGAAPGAGGPTPPPVTPGAPLGLGIGRPPGGYTGGYGSGGTTGSWNPGQAGASSSWNPATAVPPDMAQAGLPSTSGLLGMLWGNPRNQPDLTYAGNAGADIGRMGSWPSDATKPPSSYYDIQPGGGSGQGAVTGDKLQPQYPGQDQSLPQRNPNRVPPIPQRKPAVPKPKPKPKRQAQGDQARYNSKTNWESHNEAYNPIQGNFGYQPWRRPR